MGRRALLLDEPSTSLDLFAQHELRETVRKLARSGIGILLVTHHLSDIIPEIDRVILMRGGQIAADGPKESNTDGGCAQRSFRGGSGTGAAGRVLSPLVTVRCRRKQQEQRSRTEPEPRWPALVATLAVGVLFYAMPESLRSGPGWLMLVIVGGADRFRYGCSTGWGGWI